MFNTGLYKQRQYAGKMILVLLMVMPLGVIAAEQVNTCIECHSLFNEEIVDNFRDDVHARIGLNCADCHGGNPTINDEDAMNPEYGYIGVPDAAGVPNFCGRCHSNPAYMHDYNPSLPTDQVDKYWTSKHGSLLKRGDGKVATCVNCHRTHHILPANNPLSSIYPANVPSTCASCHADSNYMDEYGIPTDQYSQYTDSSNVHGWALLNEGDMGAPACNDCHGNHGAAPPGVDVVAQVCTQCHALNGRFFRASPHLEGFEMMEVSQCAFCHQKNPNIDDPHSRVHLIVRPDRHLIGTDEMAVCSQCHFEGDDGWATAASISELLDSLNIRFHRAENVIEAVEKRGLEVSDARWSLESEVLRTRMKLRTSVHAFDLEEFLKYYPEADSVLGNVLMAGNEAVKELKGRWFYFIIVTIFIAMLIIGIIMKIRNIERVE